MARRLDYKPLQEDDKLAEVEIGGKVYTFPLPAGLSTDEAMHIVDMLDGGDLEQGDFFNLMREMFNGWLGKDVVDSMPLGDFKNLTSAWVATMEDGEEGLGES
jgi:hypothetical protein